jgi:predicted outer membrane protein
VRPRILSGALALSLGGCSADWAELGDEPEPATDLEDPSIPLESDVTGVERLRATATVMGRIHRLDDVVVEFAEYAKVMAVSGDVRTYADRLVRDHERIDAMIRDLGQRLGVEPFAPDPPPGTREHVDEENRRALVRAGGLDIDRRFLRIMVRVHRQAVQWLEHERHGVHPELGETIDRIIPILRQHDELGRRLLVGVPEA